MQQNLIFLPVLAQVLLTIFVLCALFRQRVRSQIKNRVRTQALADSEVAARVFRDSENISDNFKNLFEIPVLFFAAALAIHALHAVDALYLVLLSTFVALRYAHSFIHCTYNKIMHRFLAYALSTFLILGVWILIGVRQIW